MKTWLVVVLSIFVLSCGGPKKKIVGVEKPRLSDRAYLKLIEGHTQKDEQYSGLHNLYHLRVTILNSKVNGAKLDRMRYYSQYDAEKASRMREKNFQEMSTYAQFFVSYYSPDRDLRKLASMWKFYLDHNGIKYPGKIRHLSQKDFEIRTLFPHVDRWSKPYIIEFQVPMTDIERGDSMFVMTGTAGTTEFTFKPSL